MIIELFAGVKKRLVLDFFRQFEILAKTIELVFFEVASIADTERIPINYFDLENTIIDSIWL